MMANSSWATLRETIKSGLPATKPNFLLHAVPPNPISSGIWLLPTSAVLGWVWEGTSHTGMFLDRETQKRGVAEVSRVHSSILSFYTPWRIPPPSPLQPAGLWHHLFCPGGCEHKGVCVTSGLKHLSAGFLPHFPALHSDRRCMSPKWAATGG